jgi:CubicO group peptidase (beta-lactamase class C family)
MRSLIATLAFVAIAGTPHAVCAAPPERVAAHTKQLTYAEKDAFIQMAMRSGGLPGLQTAVVKDGRIVWM